MDVFKAIEKRQSIRRYKPDPIPDDVLDRLLNVLRLAPSGSNRQPWKFIVVKDKELREQVAAACTFMRISGQRSQQTWVSEAPVIIVACGSENEASAGFYADGELYIADGQTVIVDRGKRPGEYYSSVHQDLAIALDHLSLAAVEEGLGTCWIGAVSRFKLRELLAIPAEFTAQLMMTVGYPVSWPNPRQRKPLEEIICYDRYS